MNQSRTKFAWLFVTAAVVGGVICADASGERPYSRLWKEWRNLSRQERQQVLRQYQALIEHNADAELLRRARQFAAMPVAEQRRLREAHSYINLMVESLGPRAREHFRTLSQPVKAARVLQWMQENEPVALRRFGASNTNQH